MARTPDPPLGLWTSGPGSVGGRGSTVGTEEHGQPALGGATEPAFRAMGINAIVIPVGRLPTS